MSGDRLSLTQSDDLSANHSDPHSEGWLADNVWHPFVNGTGVKQIYNNFAKEKLQAEYVPQAETFSPDWAVQSLASAGGAILTYSIVGKVAGMGLASAGENLGLQGSAARFLASDTTAQILGAGLFDFAKAPNAGETRLGNAAGSVAAFSLFSAGNNLLAGSRTIAESSLLSGVGRAAVGAAGGLTSLETSHFVSGLQGVDSKISWDDRFKAMANGGFVNVALPPLQKAMTRTIDSVINDQPWGKGVPIERYLQYSTENLTDRIDTLKELNATGTEKIQALQEQLDSLKNPLLNQLAHDNPLARVKTADLTQQNGSSADVSKNRVIYDETGGAGKLAHEMQHLRFSKSAEPEYQRISELAKTNPLQAEADYYVLRATMESGARQAENIVASHQSDVRPVITNPEAIGFQVASNGKTYFENWQNDFNSFKANPKFRPSSEFADANGNSSAARNSGADRDNPSKAERAADTSKDTGVGDSADSRARAANAAATDTQSLKKAPLAKDATTPDSLEARTAKAPATTGDATQSLIVKPSATPPEQMGATVTDSGIDFAVKSPKATKVEVLIYDKADDKAPSHVIPMQQTDGTWHVSIDGLREGTLYQYRADGPNTPNQDGSRFNPKIGLIDPEAKALSSSELPASNSHGNAPENLGDMPKSIAIKDSYDWGSDKAPNTPMSKSVIYELNVRGYTGSDETLGSLKGTYRGLIAKIPHLKELGITAVELMPIMQGDRGAWPPKDPTTGEQLRDSWNYNPVAFKAPDGSLAADGHLGQQVNEFKDLVKAMHENEIEVILDVVFNHTREGDANGPTTNLRVLGNPDYYLPKPGDPSQYADHTGCGNTLNTNNPVTQQMIIDSLQYWVKETRVDGFRFDLATIFKYDTDGGQKEKTPIMERIENDPILSKVKLIAEPWGPEQYYLGKFSDKLWSEWNGNFRDTVRKFVKSDTGQVGTLMDRIAGSPEWFDASTGRYSVNGVTFHDGMTLNDLTEFNEKHNFANGENNRDGSNDNFSWNGGWEGPLDGADIPESQKMAISSLRSRQVRNLMALMMLSRGVPHFTAGDEMRRTTNGNNNTWDQDKLNMIDWSLKDKNSDFFRFTKMMIDLRQSHGIGDLQPNQFIWHGVEPNKPDFGDGTRFIAWQVDPTKSGAKPLYSAFNSYWEPITVNLPDGKWFRLVDTNLPAGQDIVDPNQATFINKTYTIQPRSGIVLEERK